MADAFSNKRPSNSKAADRMKRELYALLASDGKDAPPIMTTSAVGGYKQNRINFGQRKVRSWKWMSFNPGRKDNFKLFHWRRLMDEGKEYPFANFAKTLSIPSFTANFYHQKLQCEDWTREESEHLLELCERFDLRFPIIADRWDTNLFRHRTIEDLKKRYYDICNSMESNEARHVVFDAEHERNRKEQLIKLYNRTAEQVEEEQKLLEMLRKIEMRKKEREKKTQDLQKMIIADFTNQKKVEANAAKVSAASRASIGRGRKKTSSSAKGTSETKGQTVVQQAANTIIENAGIKFPEAKAAGASLRSQRMKLPAAVGQKKSKAIEQLLTGLNVDLKPMPTEEICQHFNDLRSDMVLLYELKMALGNSEYELETLKQHYEAINPSDRLLDSQNESSSSLINFQQYNESTNTSLNTSNPMLASTSSATLSGSESPKKGISEVIDVGATPSTPSRKRRAAVEQGILMKKLKKGTN